MTFTQKTLKRFRKQLSIHDWGHVENTPEEVEAFLLQTLKDFAKEVEKQVIGSNWPETRDGADVVNMVKDVQRDELAILTEEKGNNE